MMRPESRSTPMPDNILLGIVNPKSEGELIQAANSTDSFLQKKIANENLVEDEEIRQLLIERRIDDILYADLKKQEDAALLAEFEKEIKNRDEKIQQAIAQQLEQAEKITPEKSDEKILQELKEKQAYLEKELERLRYAMTHVQEEQESITQEWQQHQKTKTDAVIKILEEKPFVSPDNKPIALKSADVEKALATPSPVQILKIIPRLAAEAKDEVSCAQVVQAVAVNISAAQELRMLALAASPQKEQRSEAGIEKESFGVALLKMLKKNKGLIAGLTESLASTDNLKYITRAIEVANSNYSMKKTGTLSDELDIVQNKIARLAHGLSPD